MTDPRPASRTSSALSAGSSLARRVGINRLLARMVLMVERIIPPLLPIFGTAAIFVSLGWLGVYRMLPDIVRLLLVFALVFAFVASFLPLLRLRLPTTREADRLLEERNGLQHQPVAVQDDEPAFDSPFSRALWREHQRRMAERIAALDAGLPRPDIARFDRYALRAIPALLFVTAFAYSGSNGAGSIADAFRQHQDATTAPAMRIDAWITPPAYTSQPPIFLSGLGTQSAEGVTVPQGSQMTVRLSGGNAEEKVTFREAGDGEVIDIAAKEGDAPTNAINPDAPPLAARTHELALAESGDLLVGERQWSITVIPDKAPEIAFDGTPRRALNGALEIAFRAQDDYGVQRAHAEIVPIGQKAGATPLYPPPDYKLDLPRQNARDTRGVTSRAITEHPLAGSRVSITLVATDGAGQTGRSAPIEMVLPERNFSVKLAGAVAEQRQIFSLDTREMPLAIALNEAITLRADETIPNLTHFLLIESARSRMQQVRNEEEMKDTADYLWEIALGIEDGNLSLAERRLRDAQQALADALENGATDEEIQRLMDELRAAMQEFMQALAERMPPPGQQQNAQNMVRPQDLNNLLDQLENLARSGNRDAARELLSELQRMMNNMQAGRPQQGGQQENSAAREQIDRLGEIMQQQQRLMEETFRLDQALRDRLQRGDPQQGEKGEQGQQQQGQQGQQNTDQMTAEQLREALRNLREQQEALGEQLGQLQQGLRDLGMEPGEGFGEAQREMQGAGEALGQGQGGEAVDGQGRAMEALRQGAREMMNQMMQAQQGEGGQGPQMGQGQGNQDGRDPLGRPRATTGPDFGERVRVPDEIDVQRAREILESIREKLGENSSPELERRYLERLLDIQ
ncbi:TIGR02302 family protein [Peteryoungia desertarenae]|uniref:TIGR02302 family protein n=1 Tax=Peteryoungia desertarenae TaxID=1813451 RepID=A0ABX6QJ41_9HYPH|nr:TIGR02302 family protein [Peteryoungia desertarenae]QLF68579.1 TIGR02302 family protein [Peteryoungia desertarenae]